MKFTPKEEETIKILAKFKGLSFERGKLNEEIIGIIKYDRYRKMKKELTMALPSKRDLKETPEEAPDKTPEQIRNERKVAQQNEWLKRSDEESERERNRNLPKPKKKQFQYM